MTAGGGGRPKGRSEAEGAPTGGRDGGRFMKRPYGEDGRGQKIASGHEGHLIRHGRGACGRRGRAGRHLPQGGRQELPPSPGLRETPGDTSLREGGKGPTVSRQQRQIRVGRRDEEPPSNARRYEAWGGRRAHRDAPLRRGTDDGAFRGRGKAAPTRRRGAEPRHGPVCGAIRGSLPTRRRGVLRRRGRISSGGGGR